MRTTLALDDELVAQSAGLHRLEGEVEPRSRSAHALIERESARRLARLGGSEPEIESSAPAPAGPRLILVDTSIWIDHLRAGSDLLAKLLNAGRGADASLRDLRACPGEMRPTRDRSETRCRTCRALNWRPTPRFWPSSTAKLCLDAGSAMSDVHLLASVRLNPRR